MRIGFVDHHLNNFHANKFISLLHGPLAQANARVTAAWESHPTGEDWCAKNSVRRMESAAEVAKSCDALIVLAPDHIDAHPDLFTAASASDMPVMVDKLLATSLKDAEAILKEAEKRRTPVFSASSLRFAVELAGLPQAPESPADDAFASGMGKWSGYGIHTLSLVIAGMGSQIRRVIDMGKGASTVAILDYVDGRRAVVDVREAANGFDVLGWRVGYRHADRYHTAAIKDFDGFYRRLMEEFLRFAGSGKSPLSEAEMLTAAAVMEETGRSKGEWRDIRVKRT